ncbi:hypothetical protein SAMD00019534_065490 [Acytostelium subglobosum LB1]|uniref:hypothetical protein n=1 Tax=Acytostelium subglobosum LB1 TaxID=1410327 RepID=UPI000644E673|nr:hypothetical protein SAMD00019534_065490 [Acytostelium subglobosum LB1]GAM23374.1 hypothetical protein SAMD00019534_065490 [Acytostelium subglobosum LB1]|eukprot:XP_012753823.1 hypothetical protein SAMD00019534_065490 [Acytostelium subglobosum LB1]
MLSPGLLNQLDRIPSIVHDPSPRGASSPQTAIKRKTPEPTWAASTTSSSPPRGTPGSGGGLGHGHGHGFGLGSESTPPGGLHQILEMMEQFLNSGATLGGDGGAIQLRFPRDQYLNFICIYKGCKFPIRSKSLHQYIVHLKVHDEQKDVLMEDMLFDRAFGGQAEEDVDADQHILRHAMSYAHETMARFQSLYSFYDMPAVVSAVSTTPGGLYPYPPRHREAAVASTTNTTTTMVVATR